MTELTATDSTVEPLDVVARFNDAFDRQDLDAVMALVTDDCVFEDTTPPDGGRHVGKDAVRRAWEQLFAGSPHAHFAGEEAVGLRDRVVVRWRYEWGESGADGAGHVRGVDVFRVAAGLIAEKLSYVKG
ncbi:MAG: nuclear transport factor 2 family protein [Dermatophilaceae bacterium]